MRGTMDAAKPDRAGYRLSARGVADRWSAAIDALFADCDAPGQPGVNLAVVQAGRVIHQRGYGLANIEDDIPFSPTTVLHLGSTTKHLCATCLLRLEDRGLLTLDDPVTHWVDELPAFFAAITLRHLATMTSGLADGLNTGLFSGSRSAGLDPVVHLDLLRRLDQPMFAPGAGVTYSNSNYLLLSLAIERAAGLPLDQVMVREIFEPLGMASTALVSDPSVAAPGRARGYALDAQGRAHAQAPMLGLCGDGGVVTSLEDMIRWARAYASGEMARDFRQRLETVARLPDGSQTSYALGMGVSRLFGQTRVSHGGGMPGYLADFTYLPDADLFVIWLSNRMDPLLFERTDSIVAAVLGLAEDATPTAVKDTDLDGLRSVYVDHSLGCTAEFEAADTGTVLHIMGERLALERTGQGAYRPTKTSAYFPFRIANRERNGRPIVEMKLATADWVEMIPWVETDAAGFDAADYVGEYRSQAMGETHYVLALDGGLEITLASPTRTLLWRRLKPRGGDLFSAMIPGEPSDTDVSVIFKRDAAGRVDRLDYNLVRNRGVSFSRRSDRS